MEIFKKKSILYLIANKIFLLPALLLGINITIIPDVLILVYLLYFLMFLGLLHLIAVLIISIVSICASYKKEEKMFRRILVILSIANVLLNMLSLYLFFPYAMSIK